MTFVARQQIFAGGGSCDCQLYWFCVVGFGLVV
jgi:hypothetical protein